MSDPVTYFSGETAGFLTSHGIVLIAQLLDCTEDQIGTLREEASKAVVCELNPFFLGAGAMRKKVGEEVRRYMAPDAI